MSRTLNHPQFQEFLEDAQSDYEDLTFYCEVRWPGKEKMLKRFYDLKMRYLFSWTQKKPCTRAIHYLLAL